MRHSILEKYSTIIDDAIVILIAVIVPTTSSLTTIHPPGSAWTPKNESFVDDRTITICTHDGVFHADETLGCYMLKVVYPNARIVRTRNPVVHQSCDIVVDVGMQYDPERNRYDHHQQNFRKTMFYVSSSVLRSHIRLSSAGLVYHHFGQRVLRILTGETNAEALEYLYRMLYGVLIREIDGIDNGVPQYNSSTQPQYLIRTDLCSRVRRLNKPFLDAGTWNESAQFEKAMALAAAEFEAHMNVILHWQYPARAMVQKAIEKRHDVHPSGQIIEFDEYCPWKSHFFELEEQRNISSQIKFVLFPSHKGEHYVRCVPTTSFSFISRKPLPKRWRGLQGEQLSRVVGIEGCIFTHVQGFIGGHKTREGALQMAIKTLTKNKKN